MKPNLSQQVIVGTPFLEIARKLPRSRENWHGNCRQLLFTNMWSILPNWRYYCHQGWVEVVKISDIFDIDYLLALLFSLSLPHSLSSLSQFFLYPSPVPTLPECKGSVWDGNSLTLLMRTGPCTIALGSCLSEMSQNSQCSVHFCGRRIWLRCYNPWLSFLLGATFFLHSHINKRAVLLLFLTTPAVSFLSHDVSAGLPQPFSSMHGFNIFLKNWLTAMWIDECAMF